MKGTHRALVIAATTLGCAAAVVESKPAVNPVRLATEIENENDHISALDLADRIRQGDPTLRIFDLRSRPDFENFHVPGAQQASITSLASDALPRDGNIILYSEDGAHAAQAWVLLRMRGYRKVFVLREGVYEWISRVYEPRLALDASEAERAEFARAASLSRFFGGVPHAGVPRSEVPIGYWTATKDDDSQALRASPQKAGITRRMGC